MNPKVCLQCEKLFILSSDLSQCIKNSTTIPSSNVATPVLNNASNDSLLLQKDPNCQAYSILTPIKC